MSSSESEESFQDAPPVLLKVTDDVRVESLPRKSRELYWAAYYAFTDWKEENFTLDNISENVLLTYFGELAKKYKPSSLWSKYSMLRSTISIKHNIKIDEFRRLLAFLKQKASGYEAKKSKVLSLDEVRKFLNDAPDEIYLITKVALIFGLYGACRHCELVKLKVEDVTSHGEIIKVDLKDTKNRKKRNFIIEGEPIETVRAYQALRPQNTIVDRFFLTYRNGKCISQPVGKNRIGSMPKEIAKFLGLENPEQYTGHMYRRLSAAMCANQGITIRDLNRLRGWKSTAVAEGYFESTIDVKTEIISQMPEVIMETSCNESISEPAEKKPKLKVEKMPEYKLTYFPFKGLGEPIRFILTYGGADFEDIRILEHSWSDVKPTTPNGQLPTLEVDGKVYYHTLPICRYLAKQFDIGGKTDLEDLEIDAIANSIHDLRKVLSCCYWEKNPVQKAKKRKAIVKETHNFHMRRFEDRVINNGGYFWGGKLTYVDLFFTAVYDHMNGLIGFDVIEGYPNLRRLTDKVLALPRIAAYVARRPTTDI